MLRIPLQLFLHTSICRYRVYISSLLLLVLLSIINYVIIIIVVVFRVSFHYYSHKGTGAKMFMKRIYVRGYGTTFCSHIYVQKTLLTTTVLVKTMLI